MKTSFASLALVSLLAGCAPQVQIDGGLDHAQDPIVTPPGGPIACGDAELHVVGIYDPYSSASNAQGPAHVHIDRPGSVVLFLSAYSQTDWTVTAGPDTELVSVIAHGYEPQTVAAPAGVATTVLSAASGDAFLGCGYEVPDNDPTSGCETPELLAAVEGHVGIPVTSFHGCYAASDFVIGADLTSSSDCAVQMGYTHTSEVFAGCGD